MVRTSRSRRLGGIESNLPWTTLVELLQHRASATPDALAYSFLGSKLDEQRCTYGQLHERALAVAARLRTVSQGGRPRSRLPSAGPRLHRGLLRLPLRGGHRGSRLSAPIPPELRSHSLHHRGCAPARRADVGRHSAQAGCACATQPPGPSSTGSSPGIWPAPTATARPSIAARARSPSCSTPRAPPP